MVADADIADPDCRGGLRRGGGAGRWPRGDLRRAITLYERVWRFAEALPLAERLGDPALAIRLALDAGRRRAGSGHRPGHPRRSARGSGRRQRGVRRPGALRRGGRAGRAGGLVRARRRPCTGAAGCRWRRRAPWSGRGCGTTPAVRTSRSRARRPRTGTRRPRPRPSWRWAALLGRLGRPRDAVRALQAAARHPAHHRGRRPPAVPGAGRPGPAPRRGRDRPPAARGPPRSARQRRGHRRAGAAGAQRPGAVGRAAAAVRRAAR